AFAWATLCGSDVRRCDVHTVAALANAGLSTYRPAPGSARRSPCAYTSLPAASVWLGMPRTVRPSNTLKPPFECWVAADNVLLPCGSHTTRSASAPAETLPLRG